MLVLLIAVNIVTSYEELTFSNKAQEEFFYYNIPLELETELFEVQNLVIDVLIMTSEDF